MAESKQSNSGLEFKLHPLVLISVSDHHTRTNAYTEPGAPPQRVLGALLGSHTGRVVEVSNSFEMQFSDVDGSFVLDRDFLAMKQDQYKKVFPKIDVVGWYATGAELQDMDMQIHKTMMEVNESPVFLMLNPKINPEAKDLPISLYESELHFLDGASSLIFVSAKYSIETSEAERIAVDQVAKILPSGTSSGSNQLSAHLTALHSAMKMLNSRIRQLLELLQRMRSGDTPYDHSLVRQITALVRMLPSIQTDAFKQEFLTEYTDSQLVIYLASLTKGASSLNEVVDKYNIAYDKTTRRGRAVMI
uniref:COP9 signalosome complex subunit 6 n=1 Tax=Tetraselmis chuii TaxID=63592 RepID=A0A7S1X038_9CHLO|mmetsp:Transcript_16867/g.30084  ORF Transcript_16867/g.30084 Transcript_16867/m.30084 type:complete len:304 (+) Transcript_16867:332-1243(+)|eukprot:CAMPEP_0177776294 /NCGR_PEP_ID=MMETSP0491_2-20121128/14631_1 /TAXON_ID=63592 /ORGANISM="Tetraselmis chuii, Strain PLY429" /LENGTH=303 /DNA_ID=CAMNT_0019295065 /DNA_START=332 /DNA_END=1243 /DNA_ORIENTATION=-